MLELRPETILVAKALILLPLCVFTLFKYNEIANVELKKPDISKSTKTILYFTNLTILISMIIFSSTISIIFIKASFNLLLTII